MQTRAVLVVLTVIALFAPAPVAHAAVNETILISRQSAADGGAAANEHSVQGVVSPDGRYVAFSSEADNLSAADNDAYGNVYLRDTQTNTTTLISRQSVGEGGAGADGDSSIGIASVSSGGRYVAFSSTADNLSTLDDNTLTNLFVRDMQTATTILVSRQSVADGGAGADGASLDPTISADGRFVAFSSQADNLSSADDNGQQNIFVRDLQSDTTTLVSRQSASDGGAPANGGSFDPMISGNGQFVVFESNAPNLSSTDLDPQNDIFRRDLLTNTTTLVSLQDTSAGGGNADAPSFDPTVSADGRMVSFSSDADNLGTASPAAFFHIFVRDIQAATTVLVSRQSSGDGGAQADQASDESMISGNGKYVAFESSADNLSPADDNTQQNVFVRDLVGNVTTLASRQSAADGGAGANGIAAVPTISDDGRFVSFHSNADNLSQIDNNAFLNVFLRDVLGSSTAPDTGAPNFVMKAKKKQDILKRIKVKVTSGEACAVEVRGTVKPQGVKKGKLKPKTTVLAAGQTKTLKLKPVKSLKRALADAEKAKARVKAKCTDAAGNVARDKVKVKLR